jgi:DNA-cytosine methyltransferase
MISQDYVCDGQMSIFDLTQDVFAIRKPIRLIELFAGVGSQAMALRDLGADFEHHRVVEFDRFAIASYNAIHGTDFPTMDITQVSGEDLGITDTSKYCYIMTYSFPCQDLSVAGKQKGMTKGSGTRSGLLWEVERLLNEVEHLPQVLLMENVPQVHSKANMPDFQRWIEFLESKGYCNHWQDLNAKNYGVAQNRVRCFMVSVFGDYKYEFPKPIPLTKTMKDYLEDEVDEKYYIDNEKAQKLIDKLISDGTIPQNRTEQNRDVLTSQSTNLARLMSQIASRQDTMPESAISDRTVPVLLKSQGTELERFTDTAATLMARDYKGFGNQATNGVIEWKKD